jgi:hypothetical protein
MTMGSSVLFTQELLVSLLFSSASKRLCGAAGGSCLFFRGAGWPDQSVLSLSRRFISHVLRPAEAFRAKWLGTRSTFKRCLVLAPLPRLAWPSQLSSLPFLNVV